MLVLLFAVACPCCLPWRSRPINGGHVRSLLVVVALLCLLFSCIAVVDDDDDDIHIHIYIYIYILAKLNL